MYCQYCGKQIKDGLRFCPYCGENQELDEGHGRCGYQVVDGDYKRKAKRPWLVPVNILLIISLVGALAFGAYSYDLFDRVGLPGFLEGVPILSGLFGGRDESSSPVANPIYASATDEQTTNDASATDEQTADDVSAVEEETTDYAALLPKEWAGSYEGVSSDGEPELHDMHLSFSSVGKDGHVKAHCMIHTNQNGLVTGGGSYNVEGDIDWESKEMNLLWVSWSNQGTLATKRHFQGTFNSTFDTVVGSCETLAGNSATSWQVQAE